MNKLIALAALGLLGFCFSSSAMAVSTTRMFACYDIDQEDARLACYDKLATTAMRPLDNVYANAMLQKSENEQSYILSKLVGNGCLVTLPYFFQVESATSNIPFAAIWNVRCSNGKTFAVAISKTGTLQAKVITCDKFRDPRYSCFHRPHAAQGAAPAPNK